MGEPDSWEDMDAQSSNPVAPTPPTRLNANAPSFTFNINAPSFAPVQNPYYPPPQRPAQSFYPVNQPPFVNPSNPGVPLPYAQMPVAFAPPVVVAAQPPHSVPSPTVESASVERSAKYEEPRVNTLSKEEDLSDPSEDISNPNVESKSEAAKMGQVGNEVENLEAEVIAAANGQSNGAYEGYGKWDFGF